MLWHAFRSSHGIFHFVAVFLELGSRNAVNSSRPSSSRKQEGSHEDQLPPVVIEKSIRGTGVTSAGRD